MATACSAVVLLLGLIVFYWSYEQLRDDLGQRARVQASEISLLPGMPTLISQHNTEGLALLLDPLSAKSDASYVTVGDARGIRLYHSFSPETINQPMVGGDNGSVLMVTLTRNPAPFRNRIPA